MKKRHPINGGRGVQRLNKLLNVQYFTFNGYSAVCAPMYALWLFVQLKITNSMKNKYSEKLKLRPRETQRKV